MLRKLLNFAGFQAGWFTTVFGVAAGSTWVGPLAVGTLLGLHLTWLVDDRRREARLIVAAALLGLCLDSALSWLGVLRLWDTALLSGVAPLWLIGLWALLAASLRTSFEWLNGRYLLAAGFGAIGGPLSYYAGYRLGAIGLGDTPAFSLAVLALVWALVMPVLIFLARREHVWRMRPLPYTRA
jgi:hypothetical protein